MKDQGIYHIANNLSQYEPQRENAFEFIVTDVDNILKVNAGEGEVDSTIPNAQEILKYSVISAPVPTFSQDVLTIKRGNATIKAAGVPTFDGGQLAIREFVGADSKGTLLAWQALSYNVKEQTVGNMSDYKKDCYLLEYTQDFSKLIRTWHLVNCWVSGLQESDYTVENAGIKTITATIQYDWAYIE